MTVNNVSATSELDALLEQEGPRNSGLGLTDEQKKEKAKRSTTARNAALTALSRQYPDAYQRLLAQAKVKFNVNEFDNQN